MCETIKDAGDDPDATHKARIQSTVRFVEKAVSIWTVESVSVV